MHHNTNVIRYQKNDHFNLIPKEVMQTNLYSLCVCVCGLSAYDVLDISMLVF